MSLHGSDDCFDCINAIPGPTLVPENVLSIYARNWGSPDLDHRFFGTYLRCKEKIQFLLETRSDVIFLSGEAMVGLWGALKSVLSPGDAVVSISNGIFGNGIASMAESIGVSVSLFSIAFEDAVTSDSTIYLHQLAELIATVKPRLVTLVHCETPSGTLNDVEAIARMIEGSAIREKPLFYVDFVSSGCAADLRVDDWGIDLGLLGSQKALNLPPDLAIVTVSSVAWSRIEERQYEGYDALLPFLHAAEKKYMPYSHNWRAIAALEVRCDELIAEGIKNVQCRHKNVAAYCRKRLTEMGIRLFPKDSGFASPSLTAAYIPDGWTWPEWQNALERHGLKVAGSYGVLDGVVWRIGHMGVYATTDIIDSAIEIVRKVLLVGKCHDDRPT